MTPLTICCVWVRGNVPYTAEYVERLAAMVRRATLRQFRFVCFTDRPAALSADIEVRGIVPVSSVAGWWSKLHCFNPANGLKGRVVYLDLDTLIVGSLDAIIDDLRCFATIPDGGSSFQPKDKRQVIKRFNTSVMVFDAGVYSDLWTSWVPVVANRLHGDQDWLAECHPDAGTMPLEWFPRVSTIQSSGVIPAEARVVLSKKPKNIEAAKQWPWFNAIWRAA